jgi:hypothetical protein
MHSSISSSSDTTRKYDRQVPACRWPLVFALAVALLAVCLLGWEARMRSLGLVTTDLGDGTGHWAVERRKVDSDGDNAVVIIGASRILFDTNLDRWEKVTGVRPVQLALPGTSARPFLEDLANDDDFSGLLVIGITPTSYFREAVGLYSDALDYYASETPSQRSGHQLHIALSRLFAFIDSNYTLFKLISRIPLAKRGESIDPYDDVWKISVQHRDRQTYMWPRIETDEFLRNHARSVWGDFEGEPIDRATVMKVVQTTRRDVNRIRARGGDVVFVRPPSTGPIRENEKLRAPRAEVWDTLILGTGTIGIHFEDYPAMTGLQLPEWSHLTRESALGYTDTYVSSIKEKMNIPQPGEKK